MKRVFKRTGALALAAAMLVTMLSNIPASKNEVKASETVNWTHMSDVEKDANLASYDVAADTITFGLDGGWAARMQYAGRAAETGKSYTVEFDMNIAGGAIGVYNYETSGVLYGVYIDMGTGGLDALQFTDWTTCVDDFSYVEGGVHPQTACTNWTALNNITTRIRVEFICGPDGTLAGGEVNYYRKDAATGVWKKLGSVATPANVADDAELPNYFGIQLRVGTGTVSNITVKEYVEPNWVHMSDYEENASVVSYDTATDTMAFAVDGTWSPRMNYVGVEDTAGKDWTIEFDMNVAGGALGIYNYDAAGTMYGAYLDTNAGWFDAVQFDAGWQCVDGFYFQGSLGPNVQASNYSPETDKVNRVRVDFLCGAEGTLAGGTTAFYKQVDADGDGVKESWLLMGKMAIPANLQDDPNYANYFGIHLILGSGTLSNITVKEYTEPDWIHMNDGEQVAGLAFYDIQTDKITFKNDAGWSARMNYIGVEDTSGKDWTIQFDMNMAGGALGIYNYDGAATMYGAYLDTNAGVLDAVQFDAGWSQVDGFYFYGDANPWTGISNYDPAVDKVNRIRVDFLRGEGGTLAGGTVAFYKQVDADGDSVKESWLLMGKMAIPTTLQDDPDYANYFGIHLVLGTGTVSNITLKEYIPEVNEDTDDPNANWIHMSDTEKNMGKASYDSQTDTISFVVDAGWAARMQYIGLPDISGKNYAVEFDLSVDGGELGVYSFDGSGALYGVYLDTNASVLDALQFNDWADCVDDFNFRESTTEGATVHPTIAARNWNPSTDKTGTRIRVEFALGEGGTLAGGTVTYYKKAADGQLTKIGTVNTPETVADDPNQPNKFGIQLWLGNGTVSNITVEEFTPQVQDSEPEKVDTIWDHMSTDEEYIGKAAYDEEKDTISFLVDDGWAARMKYIEKAIESGKNYAIEFDMNIKGGAIGIYSFEESGALYGVYLDTAASYLDVLQFTDWVTCADDFYFREIGIEGATAHGIVPIQNWDPAKDITDSRIRVEFICGEKGTLAGGTVNYFKLNKDTGKYYPLGSVSIPATVADDPAMENQFGIQLWLGEGTVSNITIEEYKEISVYGTDEWIHLSEIEKEEEHAIYYPESDKIVFSGCEGWAGRLINTEITDISGENFAVEFNANLGRGGAIGITPYFDDAEHFYGVYYDLAGRILDGVGLQGRNAEGQLIVLDDFAYINNALYPSFPLQALSPSYGEDVRFRIECFLGEDGTMAGGTVHFYFKRIGFSEWTRLGVVNMPDTIEDNENMANRLVLHGRLANGSISDISVIRDISNPVLRYSVSTSSEEWGYVSDYEKTIGAATYDDSTGTMILAFDGGYASRLINLKVDDVTGKAFALEFDADFQVGGAIGVVPFYEDAGNWYGVYLDRGAAKIDGVGYNAGEVFDEFDYVDATYFSSTAANSKLVLNWVRYRFEYFPAEDGSAAGAVCKLYYKQMPDGEVIDDMWRLIGEFTIPDTIVDNPDAENKIMIHARLMCATLSNINYTEIDADTVTEYISADEGWTFEDGYPEDDYQPDDSAADVPAEQEGGIPWWSIVMIVVGGAAFVALITWLFIIPLIRKKKEIEE